MKVEQSMKSLQALEEKITSLASKRLKDYPRLAGEYRFPDFDLFMDSVPQDADRSPVRARLRVKIADAEIPQVIFNTKEGEVALRDFFTREFSGKTTGLSMKKQAGGGKFYIDRPGREMLETSSVVIDNGLIEVRFSIDLPNDKGRIPGPALSELLMRRLPRVVRGSIFFKNFESEKLTEWIETYQDATALRKGLDAAGLVAFIADGSVPAGIRKEDDTRKSFRSPQELSVTLDVPNRGTIRGMGIPKGVTIIAGGLNSGKELLLQAISAGVYNHVPGDGREFIVSAADTMFVQAEDGRRIENVDISPFISGKFNHEKTSSYRIKRATMLDSQAAAVMEALEIGSSLLLIDENTSAPALLQNDTRMKGLLEAENTISSLPEILPALSKSIGVSSIVSLSASGDFLDVADTVILMKGGKVLDATAQAKEGANASVSGEEINIKRPRGRQPLRASLTPLENEKQKIRPQGVGYVQYGDEFIDMTRVPQLVSASQARGIARGLALLHRLLDRSRSLKDAVDEVMRRVETVGLDTLSNRCMGDLAVFRREELAAAVNRLKDVKMT